jgi:tetratricopeptide (TPR) repeat protein
MVESVAWIAERKNVLSTALCLAAVLVYLRYDGRGDARSYVLAWLLFLAAILAKTVVFTFPAVMLLLAWWRRGRVRWRQDVLPLLPFFAVAVGMCAVTAWLEKNHLGAEGPDYALSISERVLIAGRAFWFYLGKLIWPTDLCFIYPRWKPEAGDFRQWLYPLTAVGTLVALWLARRWVGRGPVTALLFFAGTLLPVLGFVNVYFMRYSFVCDHWVYLSSLGPIALVAAGFSAGVKHFGVARYVGTAIAGALLLALAGLTWRQAGTFTDLESLWQVTISRNPDSWVAYNSLGNALFRRGQTEEAIDHFQKAITLKPDLAEARTSLGVALASRGELRAAISQFEQAVRVNPEYVEAHYDLALAFMQVGRTGDAIAQLREALRLKPDFPAARHRLALALRRESRAE